MESRDPGMRNSATFINGCVSMYAILVAGWSIMVYRTHLMRAITFIEQNLKNDISLADCAREAGYSEYHFIRVFKEVTGLTPADYIRKRRLTEIIKHMRPDVPLSEIAFEYGFNSKENFTRAFKAEHHILPTELQTCPEQSETVRSHLIRNSPH